MIFNLNKFVIEVDIDRTKKFYDGLSEVTSECSCDGCRNYILAIADFPKEVLEFFQKLGVDIKKANEIYVAYDNLNGKDVCYQGFYHICGKLLKSRHITCGFIPYDKSSYYSIIDNYFVWFEGESYLQESRLAKPVFRMEIEFKKVPWKLNKPTVK